MKLLTEKQVAEQMGYSPLTLRQWRCLGKGPKFVMLGRSVRYRVADVNNYINEKINKSETKKVINND